MSEVKDKTVVEELANSITHGIGLALSVAGFVVLLVLSITKGNTWHIIGCSVFGITLILSYLASTLYHSLHRSNFTHVLQILDHSAIYLLIAGTYTPFTLVSLRGVWGWTLFGLVWTFAITGIIFKFIHGDRFKVLSTIGYVALGWVAVIAIKPLFAAVPIGGMAWILAGGLFYTVGVIFFAWKRLPFSHAVWHVFVMAGSICHYIAVLLYVLPAQS